MCFPCFIIIDHEWNETDTPDVIIALMTDCEASNSQQSVSPYSQVWLMLLSLDNNVAVV